jgi:hypothetical protein
MAKVTVHKAFVGDDGNVVHKGQIIELCEERVTQAVKDGWCTVVGEKVDIKAANKGTLRKETYDAQPERQLKDGNENWDEIAD